VDPEEPVAPWASAHAIRSYGTVETTSIQNQKDRYELTMRSLSRTTMPVSPSWNDKKKLHTISIKKKISIARLNTNRPLSFVSKNATSIGTTTAVMIVQNNITKVQTIIWLEE